MIRIAMDWVLAQTIDRKRRQLEAEELEYSERLARAKQKESIMRKAAKARVRKKQVSFNVVPGLGESQADGDRKRPRSTETLEISNSMTAFSFQRSPTAPAWMKTTISPLLFVH